MPESLPTVEEVFDEAIRRPAGREREQYVARACGNDSDLRQRVERLLQAAADAGSFLESSAPAPTRDDSPTVKFGTSIGPYKLLQCLGEGGMGPDLFFERLGDDLTDGKRTKKR